MSVGFHLKLTFGLKPEVDGIKIVSNCLQTIHFPSWVAHSHFDLYWIYGKLGRDVCVWVCVIVCDDRKSCIRSNVLMYCINKVRKVR